MKYYFDHAASTKPFQEVIDFIQQNLVTNYANPGALHSLGKKGEAEILEAKQSFGKLLGLSQGEFFFPPSATIANNLAVLGFAHNENSEVFYFGGEHPSLVLPILELQKNGIVIRNIPNTPASGYCADELINLLTSNTSWLYLTSVNNQSGVHNPVDNIALQVRLKFPQIKIHLDASQSLGKIDCDYSLFDSITFSSHKCGGPKNIAGLWLKNPESYHPLYFGGGQQRGLFSQTEDALLVKSFLLAVKIALKEHDENFNRIVKMQKELTKFLTALKIPIIFPFTNVSPYITTFRIPDFPSDVVLRMMDEKSCLLSSSAACSSRIKGFNPTFEKLGIEEKYHKNVVRLSFGPRSREDELEFFIKNFSMFVEENLFLVKMKKR